MFLCLVCCSDVSISLPIPRFLVSPHLPVFCHGCFAITSMCAILKINDLMHRAKLVKVHLQIMYAVRARMPRMWGAEAAQVGPRA